MMQTSVSICIVALFTLPTNYIVTCMVQAKMSLQKRVPLGDIVFAGDTAFRRLSKKVTLI